MNTLCLSYSKPLPRSELDQIYFQTDILKETIKEYNVEDFPKFKPFVTFDCRGVEPSAFSPRVRTMLTVFA